MKVSARIYNCARCGQQVILCSHCDRGNIYCFDGCAVLRRQASLHSASRRYQSTPAGRFNNAKRQARYRMRQALLSLSPPLPQEKVTHHGSEEFPPAASMEIDERWGKKNLCEPLYYCHCCGVTVSPYLRQGYLRRHRVIPHHSSSFQHRA